MMEKETKNTKEMDERAERLVSPKRLQVIAYEEPLKGACSKVKNST